MIKTVYEPFQIHPVIDRVFGFDEAREALDYLYSGSHLGKVIIQVDWDVGEHRLSIQVWKASQRLNIVN